MDSSEKNHARDCQEIEEFRSMCCGEADQARIDEIDYASREESYDCESIHGSDSGITEQCKFFVRCERNFTILKQRAALERLTFTINPLLFPVPEPCLAAILDCRTIHGILWVLQETIFLNDHLLEKDELPLSSTIQRKNLASSSLKLGPD